MDDPTLPSWEDMEAFASALKKPTADDLTKTRIEAMIAGELDVLQAELASTDRKVRRDALRTLMEVRSRWL